MSLKAKVFTIYHRPSGLPPVSGYYPILVGNAVRNQESKDGYVNAHDWKEFAQLPGLLKDDDGPDTLSHLNRSINEMSGIYWLWKNYKKIGDPDLIGISHYRRFFIFNESLPLPDETGLPNSSCYLFESFREASQYLDTSFIAHFYELGYDCLTTKMYDARLLDPHRVPNISSCEQRYYEIADFDPTLYNQMENLVLRTNSAYSFELDNLRKYPSHYTFNMFVMKRRLFFEYCNFIFPILIELTRNNARTDSPTLARAPGYLSEFLTSIFLSNQMRLCGLKVKELNTCYIENTQIDWDQDMEERHNLLRRRDNYNSFSTLQSIFLSLQLFVFLISLGRIGNRESIDRRKNAWKRATELSLLSSVLRNSFSLLSRILLKISKLLRI